MIRPEQSVFINGLVEGDIDAQVYQDVHKTFARETISFVNRGNLSITDTNPNLINRVQFTEAEISPFHKHDIDCNSIAPLSNGRLKSTSAFSEKAIALPTIQQFLVSAFAVDEHGHRPYPSAGGLYPVEPLIFLFDDKITEFNNKKSGCYHFRSVSKKLQLIKEMDRARLYDKIFHGFVGSDAKQWPAFCLLYVAHVGKAIFKYRYRGYRHALMEAGSMYQRATHISEQMGLRTTVWSTFSEQQMLYELSLDHGSFFPLTMQLFGYGD